MMFRTHRLFSILISLVMLRFIDMAFPEAVTFTVIAVLSSMIPDADISSSRLGRRFRMISWFFSHRGFFHSLLALALFSFIAFIYVKFIYALAFMIGYLSHLFLDIINRQGMAIFFPFGFKVRGVIRTNSLAEKILFYFFIFAVVLLLVF